MGCFRTIFKLRKKHKKAKKVGPTDFAIRPVGHHAAGGYPPTVSHYPPQQQSVGSDGGGGSFDPRQAANRAMAGRVAAGITPFTKDKYDPYVEKAAQFAADGYTRYEKQHAGKQAF